MAEKTRCEECDRNFPSLDALTMHNAAKHSSPIEEKKGLSKKSVMIKCNCTYRRIFLF